MKRQRSQDGRGVFYNRDSGGKHEMTSGQYIEWAQRQVPALKIIFNGTAEAMEAMIRSGEFRQGDLFLDYGVSGNKLSCSGAGLADPDRSRRSGRVAHSDSMT